MLIFRELFKTQSEQYVNQNAPNCTTFSKFSQAASIYAPELPSICVQL